ncbi:DUF7507 domain-containing protein [Agrococcus sp. Marseille-P2731]|uniref:DUF7507 domain-containing protein n=1 Tax=Agrococcus sp. Marseille-P2731 TaxID=1841862 RepID=UPI00093082D5|nr:hypothetical protein [Agrococcus sp. Marseille-P2731]
MHASNAWIRRSQTLRRARALILALIPAVALATSSLPDAAAAAPTDAAGAWQAQRTDDAPDPAPGGDATERISTELNAGAETLALESGRWHEQLSAITSYTGGGLESLVVTDAVGRDARTHRADPAADHLDVYRMRIDFSPQLARAAVPYAVEYTTDAGAGWQRFVPTDSTTASDARIAVQPAGSSGWLESGFDQALELAAGERLTSWRVTVSPDAATRVPGRAEVHVRADVVASLPSFTTGAPPSGDLSAAVTAAGTTIGGERLADRDAVGVTIADRVNLTTNVEAPTTIGLGTSAPITATVVNTDPAGRPITDAFVRVVLPRGVVYDAETGVSRAAAQTLTGRAVPDIGDGVRVATETLGDRQVVVLLLDEVASVRAAGEPRHRFELSDGYRYAIPVAARPAALDSGAPVEFEAWASTSDAARTEVPLGFYAPHVSADVHDFDPARDAIAHLSASSVVTGAGDVRLEASAAAEGGAWASSATVRAGELARWRVQVRNELPRPIHDVVVFDRLPAVGDERGSELSLALAGAIEVPAGATVEYSRDATSADTGSWSSDPAGAVAFRAALGTVAPGATVDLELASRMPSDALAGARAVNDATASGSSGGAAESFTSTRASVTPVAAPALRVESAVEGWPDGAAPGPRLRAGDTVRWSHVVTNTGNAMLDALEVAERFVAGDDSSGLRPATSDELGALAPGETRRFTSSAIVIEGAYEGTTVARATAVDPRGRPLEAQPSAATDASWYVGEAPPRVGPAPGPPPGGGAETGPPSPGRPPVVVDPPARPPQPPVSSIPFPGRGDAPRPPVVVDPPVPPAVAAPAPAPAPPSAQSPTRPARTVGATSVVWRFEISSGAADGQDIVVIDPLTGQPVSLGALADGESAAVQFGGGTAICERVGEAGSERIDCVPVDEAAERDPGAGDAPPLSSAQAAPPALQLLPPVLASIAALLLLTGLALLARTLIRNRRSERMP